MRLRIIACALLAFGMLGASASERLGRLFFTPEERTSLEESRHGGDAKARRVKVDGTVARSDGKATIWLNGRALHENSPDRKRHGAALARRPDGVLVTAGGQTPATAVRVGETFDGETGTRTDIIGTGTIRVHRPASNHGEPGS